MTAQANVNRITAAPAHTPQTMPLRVAASGGRQTGAPVLALEPMAVLIELEMEARACSDIAALKFMIVNATRKLAPFDLAVLLERRPVTNSWSVSAVSSVVNAERQSATTQAVEGWVNNPQQPWHASIGKIQNIDLTTGEQCIDFDDFPFPFGLWLPIKNQLGADAALLALRARPWNEAQHVLLTPLANAYAHAWSALDRERSAGLSKSFAAKLANKKLAAAAAIALSCAAFMPVPMSVLAPAEVVAVAPDVIAAPLDGVIADILVTPGQQVEKNTPLVRFVDTKVRNDVELAVKAKTVAEAKYFKILQSAVSSQKDIQDLSISKAELAMADADLSYAREVASRTTVLASKSGIAVFSAKSDWIGRPVSTGERIMEIADPAKTELKIDLHVSDAIEVKPGGNVALFLDGDPLHAIEAAVYRNSYRPVQGPDRQLVFRLDAKFAGAEPQRIGLRGTARVSGENVSLAYYLFRHPMSLMRQKFGW